MVEYAQERQGLDRPEVPRGADERTMLTAMLDWHRATFAAKLDGLTAQQLSAKAAPPSQLSLHGLTRHLAGVERWWFRIQLSGEQLPLLYYTDDDPDLDFEGLSDDPFADRDVWQAECRASRSAVDAFDSLDELSRASRRGEQFSLRWLLLHLVAEYARHNGHADLLREHLDGTTGY